MGNRTSSSVTLQSSLPNDPTLNKSSTIQFTSSNPTCCFRTNYQIGRTRGPKHRPDDSHSLHSVDTSQGSNSPVAIMRTDSYIDTIPGPVTNDKAELSGKMKINVTIIHLDKTFEMVVRRDLTVMDFLVKIATLFHFSVADYTIQIHGEGLRDFSSSTMIGTLKTDEFTIIPKHKTIYKSQVSRDLPFVETRLVTINLPANQLAILRIDPLKEIQNIKQQICDEKGLEQSDFILVRPFNSNQKPEVLDLQKSLDFYKINTVTLLPVEKYHKFCKQFSVDDETVLAKDGLEIVRDLSSNRLANQSRNLKSFSQSVSGLSQRNFNGKSAASSAADLRRPFKNKPAPAPPLKAAKSVQNLSPIRDESEDNMPPNYCEAPENNKNIHEYEHRDISPAEDDVIRDQPRALFRQNSGSDSSGYHDSMSRSRTTVGTGSPDPLSMSPQPPHSDSFSQASSGGSLQYLVKDVTPVPRARNSIASQKKRQAPAPPPPLTGKKTIETTVAEVHETETEIGNSPLETQQNIAQFEAVHEEKSESSITKEPEIDNISEIPEVSEEDSGALEDEVQSSQLEIRQESKIQENENEEIDKPPVPNSPLPESPVAASTPEPSLTPQEVTLPQPTTETPTTPSKNDNNSEKKTAETPTPKPLNTIEFLRNEMSQQFEKIEFPSDDEEENVEHEVDETDDSIRALPDRLNQQPDMCSTRIQNDTVIQHQSDDYIQVPAKETEVSNVSDASTGHSATCTETLNPQKQCQTTPKTLVQQISSSLLSSSTSSSSSSSLPPPPLPFLRLPLSTAAPPPSPLNGTQSDHNYLDTAMPVQSAIGNGSMSALSEEHTNRQSNTITPIPAKRTSLKASPMISTQYLQSPHDIGYTDDTVDDGRQQQQQQPQQQQSDILSLRRSTRPEPPVRSSSLIKTMTPDFHEHLEVDCPCQKFENKFRSNLALYEKIIVLNQAENEIEKKQLNSRQIKRQRSEQVSPPPPPPPPPVPFNESKTPTIPENNYPEAEMNSATVAFGPKVSIGQWRSSKDVDRVAASEVAKNASLNSGNDKIYARLADSALQELDDTLREAEIETDPNNNKTTVSTKSISKDSVPVEDSRFTVRVSPAKQSLTSKKEPETTPESPEIKKVSVKDSIRRFESNIPAPPPAKLGSSVSHNDLSHVRGQFSKPSTAVSTANLSEHPIKRVQSRTIELSPSNSLRYKPNISNFSIGSLKKDFQLTENPKSPEMTVENKPVTNTAAGSSSGGRTIVNIGSWSGPNPTGSRPKDSAKKIISLNSIGHSGLPRDDRALFDELKSRVQETQPDTVSRDESPVTVKVSIGNDVTSRSSPAPSSPSFQAAAAAVAAALPTPTTPVAPETIPAPPPPPPPPVHVVSQNSPKPTASSVAVLAPKGWKSPAKTTAKTQEFSFDALLQEIRNHDTQKLKKINVRR